MATRYNPSIVTRNLILCMDPANPQCLTGSGALTMFNLGERNISGTLVGPPTFDRDGGGCLVYNGSNYVDLGQPPQLEGQQVPLTICGFVMQTTVNSFNPIYSAYQNFTGGGLLWSLVRFDSQQFVAYTSTSGGSFTQYASGIFPSLNNWHYFAWVVSGSLSQAWGTGYIDTASAATVNQGALDVSVPSVEIYIGNDGVNERWIGKIGPILLYNRDLSPAEVRQNYFALRKRYGLP